MNSIIKILVLLVSYLIGQFSYDTIYSLSLKTIGYFTNDKIHFYGKLWDFFGKPSFGCLALLLPVLGFLGIKVLKLLHRSELWKYWVLYSVFIGIFYFTICYFYGQYLLNLIRSGKIFSDNFAINLSNVNLYIIGALTIVLASIFTFVFYRFALRRKSS